MAFDDLSDAQLELIAKLAQKLTTGRYKPEFRVLTRLMSAGPEIHLFCVDAESAETPIKHFRESTLDALGEKGYIVLNPEGHPDSYRFIGSLTSKTHQQYDLHTCEKAVPVIGIITALEKEYAAVKVLLENQSKCVVPGPGAGRHYLLGEVSSLGGGKHSLVLSLADMGNNAAAARATLLLEHFPTINSIIMVGIAGGVPHPEKPSEHVRLGDIVISNEKGIVQYDFIKEEISETIHRHPPRPPSATLLEGVRYLEVGRIEGQYLWLEFIGQTLAQLGLTRPPEETDILASSTDPEVQISHPEDPRRIRNQPRVFRGPIASANTLLKNPIKRDELRDKFGVKAIEMEGSGIADASWRHEASYLVVRGICDYCDSNKGDAWQEYAAVVAAAYTRALLESIPCQTPRAEHVRTLSYQSNLLSQTPRLSFSTDIDFSPPTPAEKQVGAKRSWFIRLRIENSGQVPARNCFGRLLQVTDEKGHHLKQFDSLDLYWRRQDTPDDFEPLDIRESGDFQYLDIAQVKEAENVLTLRAIIPHRHRLVIAPEHTGKPEDLASGIYYVQIGIYADNASIEPTWFKIKWEDDYSIETPCSIDQVDLPSPSNTWKVSAMGVLLESEQQNLLSMLVRAVRDQPREKRCKFRISRGLGQQPRIIHPGLPHGAIEVYMGDIEILARENFLVLSYDSRGSPVSFDVTPRGFKYCEQEK